MEEKRLECLMMQQIHRSDTRSIDAVRPTGRLATTAARRLNLLRCFRIIGLSFETSFELLDFLLNDFFLVIRVPVFDNESHSMKSISYNRATDIQYSMSWSP